VTQPPEGEARDFDDFFRSNFQRVVGAVALVTGDTAHAEDAAQEAFHRAYARWDRLRGQPRPDVWATKVATNIAIDSFRKRKREVRIDAESDERLVAADNLVSQQWIRWALGTLSLKERQAIVLRDSQGWDLPDIASETGLTIDGVRQRLTRAHRRLRKVLAGERTA
jgi:RNA polymerase sigma-70 factor (ECF subfamily)